MFSNSGVSIFDLVEKRNENTFVTESVLGESGLMEDIKIDASILNMASNLNSDVHVSADIGRDDYLYGGDDSDRVRYDIDANVELARERERSIGALDLQKAINEAFPPPQRPPIQMLSTNKSAVNMARLLYILKVKRWYLPLLLLNPDIDGLDPHDPSITDAQKQAILTECNSNLFYFAREVARIPVAGPKPASCVFHLGSFTAMYFSTNNTSYYLEQPRQTYKTGTDAIINVWYWNFACENVGIGIFAYKDTKVKENLQEIIKILNLLPDYMKLFKWKINKDINTGLETYVSVPDFARSVQTIYNHLKFTKITAKTTGQTRETAINAGRGASYVRLNFDEIGFCKYNWLAYGSAQPAFDEVASVAKQNGLPHSISMTSTPPDATTKEGEWLHKLLFEECVPFSLKMFDLSPDQMQGYLRANGQKDIVFCSFMYNELGFTEEWLVSRYRKSSNDTQFEVDVLLKWKRDVTRSPFNRRALESIEVIAKNSKYDEYLLDNKYLFKLYAGFKANRLKKVIVGCDVAGGGGSSGLGDYSTMVGVDPNTTEILFTFRANTVDPEVFSKIIVDFTRTMVPNAILVIERNNMGVGVVSKLKYIEDIEPKLYYTRTNTQQEVFQMADKSFNDKNQMYGFSTGQANREIMYKEILHTRVNRYKRLFNSSDIVRELMSVYVSASGRYDHLPGYHDDLLMAYLFTLYVLYKDIDMYEKFGIGIPTVLDDESNALSNGEDFKKIDNFSSNDTDEDSKNREFIMKAMSKTTHGERGYKILEEETFAHELGVVRTTSGIVNDTEFTSSDDGTVVFGNNKRGVGRTNSLRGKSITPF